jgi:hypothetical protein
VSEASSFATALAATAALGGGDRAAAILARIGGRDGVVAREAFAALAGASPEELAAITARLRAPRPAGLDDVHPDWLARAPATSSVPAVRTWIDRTIAGPLVAMPGGEVGRLTSPVDLARARPDWLALRLERLGLRQLAHATAGADRVELAALAARLGFLRGKAYVEAIAKVRELGADALAGLGPRRAAQARCAGVAIARDRLAFLTIGARAIAPHVATAGGDLPYQIAQRLPRAPGVRARDELLAWAHEPIAAAPAWAEILSPS